MISIIIPVYNVAPYLDECLQSVVNQMYTDWECILVDDGSTDGSSEICDAWGKKDSRFVVCHQENGGVSKARNCGIRKAKGEYIVFIDSDDWVGKQHLWELVNAEKADLVVSGIKQEYSDGTSREYKNTHNKTFPFNQSSIDDIVGLYERFMLYGPVAKLYVASIIKEHQIEFPLNCSYGEDLQFNLMYLEFVASISQIDDVSYYYRRGSDTLSTTHRPNQFQQDYEQWELLQKFYERHGLWLKPAKEMLYKRLWGIIYDGLFSSNMDKKHILSIPEIKELKDFQYVFPCSGWIKWCILHKIAFVFR